MGPLLSAREPVCIDTANNYCSILFLTQLTLHILHSVSFRKCNFKEIQIQSSFVIQFGLQGYLWISYNLENILELLKTKLETEMFFKNLFCQQH